MPDLLVVQVNCDRKGNLESKFENPGRLTESQLANAIAFSAPALLAHQLSILKVKQGWATAEVSNNLADESTSGPRPIEDFYTDFRYLISSGTSKYLEGVKEELDSIDMSIAAKLILISSRNGMRIRVNPQIGLFSKFPEERMSMLVANYQYKVLRMELGQFSTFVPVAINYVRQQFFDNFDQAWNFLPQDFYNKKLGSKMLAVSLSLYDTWQAMILNTI